MEVDEEADEVPELNRTSNSQMGFFAVGGEAEPSVEMEDAEMEEEERGRSPVKSAKKSAKKFAGKASVQKSAKASVKKAQTPAKEKKTPAKKEKTPVKARTPRNKSAKKSASKADISQIVEEEHEASPIAEPEHVEEIANVERQRTPSPVKE